MSSYGSDINKENLNVEHASEISSGSSHVIPSGASHASKSGDSLVEALKKSHQDEQSDLKDVGRVLDDGALLVLHDSLSRPLSNDLLR